MKIKSSNQGNKFHGRRAEIKPVDDAANISKEEIRASIVSGAVVDCLKLNVRKEPSIDAEVLAVIPADSEVVIDIDASVSEFYKICTVAGIEGFCMRKYIALK